MLVNNMGECIGKTPLLEINESVHNIPNVKLFAKLELLNPYGSLKDRVAKKILDFSKAEGKIVIESSSGNTAKALAGLTNIHGLPFKTITNRIKQEEVRKLLQTFGADIEELPGHSECPDPNDPKDPIKIIEDLVNENDGKYFHTNQYFNEKNIEAHKETGREIIEDVDKVNYFFGFLGTCGSTRGIGSILKDNSSTKIVGVVTENGEYVPGGRTESELYEVGFFDKEFYDGIVKGTIKEAIDGMLTLVREIGIPCGPTSGLIYAKLKEYFDKFPVSKPTNVVFIVCDRIESYMSYLEKHKPRIFLNETQGEEPLSFEEVKHAPSISLKEIGDEDIIIDIRSNFAYKLGHLKNSINIDSYHFEELIRNGPIFSRDKRIIITCPKGIVSKKYVARLLRQGYDSYTLDGGIFGSKDNVEQLCTIKQEKYISSKT